MSVVIVRRVEKEEPYKGAVSLPGSALTSCRRSISPFPRVVSPDLGFRGTISEGVSSQQAQKQSLLLFGDSLTLGTIGGAPNHPYGKRLAEKMGAAGDISVSGWAGELAMNMGGRLQKELMQRKANPPSHVVILAGTNDVRTGMLPETLLQHLTVLHNMVRASGAKCVAVTIPQCGQWDMTTVPLAQKREIVNRGLRSAALAGAQGRGPPLWLADFDAVLARLPAGERNALFSDSCHFTPSGYDMLGELVHAAVQSSLPQTAAGASPTPAQETSALVAAERLSIPASRRASLPGLLYSSRSAELLRVRKIVHAPQPCVRQYVASH